VSLHSCVRYLLGCSQLSNTPARTETYTRHACRLSQRKSAHAKERAWLQPALKHTCVHVHTPTRHSSRQQRVCMHTARDLQRGSQLSTTPESTHTRTERQHPSTGVASTHGLNTCASARAPPLQCATHSYTQCTLLHIQAACCALWALSTQHCAHRVRTGMCPRARSSPACSLGTPGWSR
jgi:hypothetical protein